MTTQNSIADPVPWEVLIKGTAMAAAALSTVTAAARGRFSLE